MRAVFKLNGSSGRYFILWDIVDPRTESNPNPNPNPEPNPKLNPNPNPDPNCGFTISHKIDKILHKMKYLRHMMTADISVSRS